MYEINEIKNHNATKEAAIKARERAIEAKLIALDAEDALKIAEIKAKILAQRAEILEDFSGTMSENEKSEKDLLDKVSTLYPKDRVTCNADFAIDLLVRLHNINYATEDGKICSEEDTGTGKYFHIGMPGANCKQIKADFAEFGFITEDRLFFGKTDVRWFRIVD